MNEQLKTVFVEPPYAELIGRDIEVRTWTHSIFRGPIIGIRALIDPSGKTSEIFTKLAWAAVETGNGWQLFAESSDTDSALPIRWIAPLSIRFIENNDGTLSHYNIVGEFKIHRVGDNLNLEET